VLQQFRQICDDHGNAARLVSRLCRFASAHDSPPDTPQGAFAMDGFVERQNIAHYIKQLKTETDPIRRVMLEQLLAEEKVKQASHVKVEK
jgi:hypothetical protein